MPQSLAVVLIHLVYGTKNRQPFLTPEIDPELYAYQGAVFREMGCPALIINGTADHVYALFSLARTSTICDLAEEVKKRSSKRLKTKGAASARRASKCRHQRTSKLAQRQRHVGEEPSDGVCLTQ